MTQTITPAVEEEKTRKKINKYKDAGCLDAGNNTTLETKDQVWGVLQTGFI